MTCVATFFKLAVGLHLCGVTTAVILIQAKSHLYWRWFEAFFGSMCGYGDLAYLMVPRRPRGKEVFSFLSTTYYASCPVQSQRPKSTSGHEYFCWRLPRTFES